MSTTLRINLNDETAITIKTLAEENDTSVTDIVHRAVSVYNFFVIQQRKGKKIIILGKKITRIVKII